MSVLVVRVYSFECDRCQKTSSDYLDSMPEARAEARKDGWTFKQGEDLCPGCGRGWTWRPGSQSWAPPEEAK